MNSVDGRTCRGMWTTRGSCLLRSAFLRQKNLNFLRPILHLRPFTATAKKNSVNFNYFISQEQLARQMQQSLSYLGKILNTSMYGLNNGEFQSHNQWPPKSLKITLLTYKRAVRFLFKALIQVYTLKASSLVHLPGPRSR